MGNVVNFADLKAAKVAQQPPAPQQPAPRQAAAVAALKPEDGFDYQGMMRRALFGVIKEVLNTAQAEGLPQRSSLYLTFETKAEGVELAPWLVEKHPEVMTIIVDQWWRDLVADDQGFTITLNFNDVPETMRVPFEALTRFIDAGVGFGFNFKETVQ